MVGMGEGGRTEEAHHVVLFRERLLLAVLCCGAELMFVGVERALLVGERVRGERGFAGEKALAVADFFFKSGNGGEAVLRFIVGCCGDHGVCVCVVRWWVGEITGFEIWFWMVK